MRIQIADRLKQTEEYYFSKKLREVEELNNQGKDIINLGIGSPDFMPPTSVINTLIEEAQRIMKAQSSRGVDFDEGSFKEKVRGKAKIRN